MKGIFFCISFEIMYWILNYRIYKSNFVNPAWEHLTLAAVHVEQVSIEGGCGIRFSFADSQRYAVCFPYERFIVAANNAPWRENWDAHGAPNTAFGWKILSRCSRPKVVV